MGMNEKCMDMNEKWVMADDANDYLSADEYIDFGDKVIQALARQLKGNNDKETIENTFKFVRDKITHSRDAHREETPAKASDVLQLKTGLCWAKSNLLAALLRANEIPCGIMYQRLPWNHGTAFCIHALNAVCFNNCWIRIDARGNRPGVDAQFDPPLEKVAFDANRPGCIDYQNIYAHPSPKLMNLLETSESLSQVCADMPDTF